MAQVRAIGNHVFQVRSNQKQSKSDRFNFIPRNQVRISPLKWADRTESIRIPQSIERRHRGHLHPKAYFENPATFGSPTSAGISTDQIPPNAGRTFETYSDDNDDAVDPNIVRDEKEEDEGDNIQENHIIEGHPPKEEEELVQSELIATDDSMNVESNTLSVREDIMEISPAPMLGQVPAWMVPAKVITVEVVDIGPTTVVMSNSEKVGEICEYLKRIHKGNIKQRRKGYVLTHNGNVLENSKKLSEYSIENMATLKFEKL